MGSFSVWHWLIVLLIVVLIFGTKKLKNIGTDLGSAVKGFKDGVRDGTAAPADPAAPTQRETKRDWIEIEIVYDDGTPYDGNCHVQLPSGAETDGAPDEDGVVRIDGLLPGSCRVSFPDLDASVWDPG